MYQGVHGECDFFKIQQSTVDFYLSHTLRTRLEDEILSSCNLDC